MAINNNFYATVNELVARAGGNAASAIVDYRTFVDFGVKLNDLQTADKAKFMNDFAAEIANKVKVSIDTVRSYTGELQSLVRGQVSPNAVIELITHSFFETRAAAFVGLTDDATVDQYVINKGGQDVSYYTKDNAYQIPVTIQATELEGAFQSPEAMDRFLQDKITYALNSNELAREEGRRGILGEMIQELTAKTVVADDAADLETSCQHYKLVSMYNDTYGLTGTDALDADTALYNGEFIKFAKNIMKKVAKKMSKPSANFNSTAANGTGGIKTFTPDTAEDRKLIVVDAFDSAMQTYVYQDARRPEDLGPYETVAFWQSADAPLVVSSLTVDPASGQTVSDETKSPEVIGVMFDKFACGEYLCLQAVDTTPYNARGRYYNNWINVQTKYAYNRNANQVVFTLE